MPTDTPTPESAAAITLGPMTARPSPKPPARRQESSSDWMHVVGGICVAGGIYPVVLVLLYDLLGLLIAVAGRFGVSSLRVGIGELLLFVPISISAAFVGATVGVMWTAIVALPTAAVFSLFVRSIRLRVGVVWLGAILGGLVGFLAATLLLTMVFREDFGGPPISLWQVLLIIAAGPCMTTVLGQAGGAWGSWRAAGLQARCDALLVAAAADVGIATPPADEPTARRTPRFQFRLRQLLWLTVWLSLLLAGATATGQPLAVLGIMGIWLVYQTVTLFVGAKLLRLVARWRTARRERRGQVAAVAAKK